MKANEAPEKIWINPSMDLPKLNGVIDRDSIQYIRKNAFIEKVTNFLNYKLGDVVNVRVPGTLIPEITTRQDFIEDFKKYIED